MMWLIIGIVSILLLLLYFNNAATNRARALATLMREHERMEEHAIRALKKLGLTREEARSKAAEILEDASAQASLTADAEKANLIGKLPRYVQTFRNAVEDMVASERLCLQEERELRTTPRQLLKLERDIRKMQNRQKLREWKNRQRQDNRNDLSQAEANS